MAFDMFSFQFLEERTKWQSATSKAVFLTPVNLQIAMSFDRFRAVCYPLSYQVQKGKGYEKLIIGMSVACGLLCGYYYAVHLCVINGEIFNCIESKEFKFNYRGVMAIWIFVSTFSMLFFNGSIIYIIYKRVSSKRIPIDIIFTMKFWFSYINDLFVNSRHSREVTMRKKSRSQC